MREFLNRQYPNLILFAPFVIAFGAVAYFVWPYEPAMPMPWLVSALIAAVLVFVIHVFRKRHFHITYYISLIALLLFGFGFFYAAATTHAIDTPIIPHSANGMKISGIVTRIDYTSDRSRIFVRIKNPVDAANRPHIRSDVDLIDGAVVRLSLKPEEPIPKIGDAIRVDANLFKPDPADAPGAFDMAEYAYFHRLTATGYPIDDITIDPGKTASCLNLQVSKLRDSIHTSVAAHGNPTALSLTDSLILGQTRAIGPDATEAAAAAGISHIFVIGGFHLTLIAGWIFAFFYLLVRLIPPLYRRVPARVPALVCVWMGLLFYLALSGAAVSTMRAFVMATLGFLALIFARHILTMRNICLCFALIILINPHYIMEAGFQMSFAAVFGILYLFSDRRYIPKTPVRRAWHAVRDVLMATLIATVFTMPFVAYNFHTVQIYGFLGNLLAMPIFAFAIIPLVVIGTILGAGFGHFLALDTAAYVYGFAMRITNWIASLPHAVINVPRIPGISVILFVISAIIVMFIIGHKRAKIIIASILIAIAVLIAVMMPKPIFYATPDHELVAFMTDNGHLQFNRGHDATHKMTFDSWDQLNGDPAGADHVPIKLGYAGATYSTNCDDKVCVYKTPNWKLTYVQQFVPLYKNIARICDADPGPNDKRSASLGGDGSGFLVTFFDIDAPECGAKIIRGGLVIYETGRIEYVRANRIWDK